MTTSTGGQSCSATTISVLSTEMNTGTGNGTAPRQQPLPHSLTCSNQPHSFTKPKNLNTFFLFFFNQEHNLQTQAILTSECGEVKACTCPTISQNEILHQEQASGKIYRDRQNDAGFKPKNGFLFQGVKERH